METTNKSATYEMAAGLGYIKAFAKRSKFMIISRVRSAVFSVNTSNVICDKKTGNIYFKNNDSFSRINEDGKQEALNTRDKKFFEENKNEINKALTLLNDMEIEEPILNEEDTKNMMTNKTKQLGIDDIKERLCIDSIIIENDDGTLKNIRNIKNIDKEQLDEIISFSVSVFRSREQKIEKEETANFRKREEEKTEKAERLGTNKLKIK